MHFPYRNPAALFPHLKKNNNISSVSNVGSVLQVDPDKYKSIFKGFSITIKEDGMRGLAKGWAPTFIGYSMQGLCKFGFYEVFKITYSDFIGEVSRY